MRIVQKTEEALILDAPRGGIAVVVLAGFGTMGAMAFGVGMLAGGFVFVAVGAVFLGLAIYGFVAWGDTSLLFDAAAQNVTVRRKTLFGVWQWQFAFDEVTAVAVHVDDGSHTLKLRLRDGRERRLEEVYSYNPSVAALADEIEDWRAAHGKTAT